MKYLFSLLSLLFFVDLEATRLASVEVTDLYKEAEIVILVEIESGQLIKTPKIGCETKYRGKVEEILKGKLVKDSLIDFSSYKRVRLGDKFLIFLSKRSNQINHISSTNSYSYQIDNERKKVCNKLLPKYQVIHSGNAMLKTHYAPITNSKKSFLVYGPVTVPKTMKSYFISMANRPDTCKIYSTCTRVEKESMFNILKRIK
jgi:hypothetical protein